MIVDVQSLSFRFQGSSDYALRDVSLSVAPGEFVVVAGPSGCGKSTLALGLGGYLSRRGSYGGELAGRTMVAGLDVQECPVYDVAEVVGLVQQNPEAQFCTLTVEDEVAFGLENRCLPRDEIRRRLDWALGIVGARYLAGRSLATLSGGEKQKVAIAAVMAARPQLLILDEPTSSLDPTATAEIFQVIAAIRSGGAFTVIVVEHKLEYLRPFAPRLIGMERGTVVYDGPLMPALPSGGRAKQPDSALGRDCPEGPVVRAADLALGYDSAAVVQNVSLEVHPGELVAVMGDNGSGKSTFLLGLLGLLKPRHGRLEVVGHDTGCTPTSRLAREVGFVFQNPDHQLFAESVWQEAVLALSNLNLLDEQAECRAAALLERCGLGDRRLDPPYRLSYGQKRRLNLVSALAHAPRLVLLDEVLIGQDPDNAAFIMGLLCDQARQGAAVIMVNHDPEMTWRYASRLVFFDGGRVAVDAPVEEGLSQLAAMGRRSYLPRRPKGADSLRFASECRAKPLGARMGEWQ